jgi:hypothetical protein
MKINWTRGLFRLWLVASLLWAAPIGWLAWPGNAPQEYARYWYYRVAHLEVLKERRANEAAATKQRDAALAEIRTRYDATRVTHVAPTSRVGTLKDLTLLELKTFDGFEYDRPSQDITQEELEEVDKVLRTEFPQPESDQLQEFTTLEGRLDWNGERASWWAAYTFAPPIAVLIVGASLLWALRGFRRTP